MNPDPASQRPIIALVEILMDLIVPSGQQLATADSLTVREGGAPMNAAIAMARLGLPVRFCGVVGQDAFGSRLRALLERGQIDTSTLRATPDAATSLAFTWKDARGDG